MNNYYQISLNDTFSDCQNLFIENPSSFFSIFEEPFDFYEFIPFSFHNAFYLSLGRNKIYHLTVFLLLFFKKSSPSPLILCLFSFLIFT